METGSSGPCSNPSVASPRITWVDLGGREPGDLYRRVEQGQVFELNLQRIEIPLPFFRQAIGPKTQDALFVWAQILDAHTGDSIKAQLLRRLKARFAVNELVAETDKDRVAKTEETDRGRDLTHMSGIELPQFPSGGSKLFDRHVGKLQAGEPVVPPRGAGR